ncbi:MAG: hypothetical protein WA159_01360 [Variovorax sp.]
MTKPTPESPDMSGSSTVNPLVIEYITRDLFKGKSLQAACRSFARKFNGEANLFLGTVNYTVEELVHAVLADKAALAIANSKRMRPGCAAFALSGTAATFNLDTQQLSREICRQLTALFPDQPENDGSEDGAVALMNATRELSTTIPADVDVGVDANADVGSDVDRDEEDEDELAAADHPHA